MRFTGAGWMVVLGMAGAAAAALLATGHSTSEHQPSAPMSQPAASAPSLATPSGLAATSSTATPSSLAGTDIPTLPVDAGGHLAHTRQVREFFDYYLTAQHETAPSTLDLMVKDSIATQLGRKPAAAEAVDLWQRYRAYLAAVAQLPGPPGQAGKGPDIEAIAQSLDQRMQLADRYLGQDGWSDVFFGDQLKRQRNDLERLRINADTSLTAPEKAARLAQLDAQLPPDERALRKRSQQQDAAITRVMALQAQGASVDEIRDQVAQTMGPEAANRAVQMEQTRQDWQARYAQYAEQRAQIDQQTLPSAQHDALVAQLRQRFFSSTSELTRAAAFDRAAGR
ncbi:lipase secretion chaperone [Dyella sp. GSA-30]|uniref:lipase secretion chaperone n=1 Tax=Dyella sp. GSA-30 TaxID=2994496 RepID=UPI0024918B66|nr:lipase secretion chaperone [Dyella sp. GSA-30]BDU21356.1 lipase chaperone [Dyella sp. GSA-30]